MKKPWIIFLICIAAGIALSAFLTTQKQPAHDNPARIPTKAEIVTAGLSTYDITKTGDEGMISQLMQPTAIVRLVTQRLLDIACKGGSELCKLQAIYDFSRMNYEYEPVTPEHGYIQSAGETLLQGSGDDLDLAIMQAAMERSAGFNNEILRSTLHTFLRVHVANETVIIDPSCAGCKFMAGSVTLSGKEDVFK